MSETPVRRFWQIHLSTALVVSLLSGVLLWLNVPQFEVAVRWEIHTGGDFINYTHIFFRGWPFKYPSNMTSSGTEKLTGDYYIRGAQGELVETSEEGAYPFIVKARIKHALVVDIAICLVILSLAVVFCESLIRRRGRRRS